MIVETARGIEYGTVTGKVQDMPEEKVVQPLKPVLRVANAEDNAKAARNREREREAMAICKEKIRKQIACIMCKDTKCKAPQVNTDFGTSGIICHLGAVSAHKPDMVKYRAGQAAAHED